MWVEKCKRHDLNEECPLPLVDSLAFNYCQLSY